MSTQTKFTPGPWHYSRTHAASSDCWYVITDADGYGPIVDVGGKDRNGQIAEAKYLVTNPTTIEANARLIAAAPLMYETLEQMVWTFEKLGDGKAMQAARAALKAARGDDEHAA